MSDAERASYSALALRTIVEHVAQILHSFLGGLCIWESPSLNNAYLLLIRRAKELAEFFPEVRDALDDVLEMFPNLYEAIGHPDSPNEKWEYGGQQLVLRLKARASEAYIDNPGLAQELNEEDNVLLLASADILKRFCKAKAAGERRLFGPQLQATLTDAEEKECTSQRFKSRLPIEITGHTEARKGNVVKIAEAEVVLPDALFRLFLRLIVALYETSDGFLCRNDLRYGEGSDSEFTLAPEGLDQAVSRLRTCVRPALKGLKPTQFIEFKRKRLRLSTHRAYVIANKQRLVNHPNEVIRSLAARLPTEKQGTPEAPTPV